MHYHIMYPYHKQYCYPQATPKIDAIANIKGGSLAPNIHGIVYLKDVIGGTQVFAKIYGLPPYKSAQNNENPIGPHCFHIHEFGTCEIGDPNDPFQTAGQHWDPTNQPHGNHAGDFPVLFSNNGFSCICFFTNKFKPIDAIDKAVILHKNPDDYRSQPTGDAGKRLTCGVVKKVSYTIS